MSHAQAMVKAFLNLGEQLQQEAVNAADEGMRDACLYLANDIIPDEIKFWEYEVKQEGNEADVDHRFCTECQTYESK